MRALSLFAQPKSTNKLHWSFDYQSSQFTNKNIILLFKLWQQSAVGQKMYNQNGAQGTALVQVSVCMSAH